MSLRLVAILTAVFLFALSPVLHAQSATLEPVEAIPEFGTFWSLQLGDGFPPMPCFPSYLGDVKVYSLGEGNDYMYDDLDFDYESYWAKQAEMAEADGLKWFDGGGRANSPLDYGTNDLWLEITAVTNDLAFLTLHNTVTNQPYALLTKSDLTWSNWTTELLVIGAVTNATTAQLATQARTNLFVWARTCNSSNLTVDDSPTPEQLVKLLVGTCVTISNVTYTGATVARGTFTNGICAGLPIDSGVILSSGDITNAIGPNNDPYATTMLDTDGDTDLDDVISSYTDFTTFDAAVLEFDIISSTASNIVFEYIFASEEYPSYQTSYDDVVAIFVDGVNIALVPFTSEPITIFTINSANHSEYYQDNPTTSPVFNIQYNGLTTLLRAEAAISVNVSHHVKIAIADTRDNDLDSAIFIKAQVPCP